MVLCPRLAMRRSIFFYVFGIVIPAFALLYLGLQSVQRQRQAIAPLAESNRGLAAEKLASRVQPRSRELASECPKHRIGCEIGTFRPRNSIGFPGVLGARLAFDRYSSGSRAKHAKYTKKPLVSWTVFRL